MLIGSDVVVGAGAAETLIDPKTGEKPGGCSIRIPRTGQRRHRRCARSLSRLVAHHAGRTQRPAPQARRRNRDGRAGTRRPGGEELRQAAASGAPRTKFPHSGRCFRFFAWCGAHANRADRRGISRWPHQHDPPRRNRRRRLYRALELSLDDGRVEARSGSGGRQLRGAEAVRADAAFNVETCPN